MDIYRRDVAPTISGVEADALAARAAAEQQIVDQYGPELANKLRDAAGNRELIEAIVADATGEASPAGLSQLITDAGLARGQYTPMTQPAIGEGRAITAAPVAAEAEQAYIGEGRASLQPSIDAGLLGRGQAELVRGEDELDTALRARAMERLSGGLTSAEQRNLQQAQRGAWAARGMAGSVPSAISEAMYVAERGEERQRLNEQMARGVSSELEGRRLGRAGLGAGLLGQAYGQRLGAYQTDIGRGTGQQQLGLQAQLANQGAGLQAQQAMQQDELARAGMGQQYGLAYQGATEDARRRAIEQDRAFRLGAIGVQDQLRGSRFGRQMGAAGLAQQTGGDPFLSLLGRPSGVSGQVPGWGGQAAGFYGQAGPKIFQPESQMHQDLAMANQQTLLGARSAQAAASGQMWGGLFGGVGSALGGWK